jgi:hypothetical protein
MYPKLVIIHKKIKPNLAMEQMWKKKFKETKILYILVSY